ncbi:MAG: hypothetical protein L0Y70_29230 [Gemmataceae bacterium]|nr:hypothetical protein [Gemmataceae bacterium]
MTEAVQSILTSFDALPESDKRATVVEILRRFGARQEGDVSEAALVGLAEELFLALDKEEAEHASR